MSWNDFWSGGFYGAITSKNAPEADTGGSGNFLGSIGTTVGSFVGDTTAATIKPIFVYALIILIVYVFATTIARKVIP